MRLACVWHARADTFNAAMLPVRRALRQKDDDGCACPFIWKPVCSSGKTFASACAARCAGAEAWVDGCCHGSLTESLKKKAVELSGKLCPCPLILQPGAMTGGPHRC